MTTKCLFCNNIISQNRRQYCSVICIKRAWYVRNNPNKKSFFIKNSDFWKTETGIGFKWEKYAAKLLGAKHLKFNKTGADLDWDGKLVDVKAANLWKRKMHKRKPVGKKVAGGWVFNRNKIKLVDFFFCIALLNNKPHKIFLIPSKEFNKTGITIGHISKYDKFLYKPD